jgi:hypothetical protein
MEEKFLSLYDYLGKAAGGQLGQHIFAIAKANNIKTKIKEINNPKYTGKIVMYPESFLKETFNKGITYTTN